MYLFLHLFNSLKLLLPYSFSTRQHRKLHGEQDVVVRVIDWHALLTTYYRYRAFHSTS